LCTTEQRATGPIGKIEAIPGAVVAWSVPGTTRCSMGTRSWKALQETCYYPIDLMQKPAVISVSRHGAGPVTYARISVLASSYGSEDIALGDIPQAHPSPSDLRRNSRDQVLPELSEVHSGADYAAAIGSPVAAVADGTVAIAEDLFFPGKVVFVDHGDGLVSMYFHLSEVKVHAGQDVKKGETVGLAGTTGRVTGPHLHLGVRWHGARINPKQLLEDPARILAIGR
jgi:murein DD-endopeptidase MepM/ murein hydrolase activator NlpD